jgi:pentatricopeptide repeat protein
VTSKLFLLFSSLIVFTQLGFAQAGRDEVLAKSYFQQGEFDKAAELYQNLWEQNNFSVQFLPAVVSLVAGVEKMGGFGKGRQKSKSREMSLWCSM